jgi:type I restriction enzyme S subunit
MQDLASLRDWLLPMLMNGQLKIGEANEYVQEGEVGMAAEEINKYEKAGR